MATSGGARALMLQDQIGTLEIGKRADIILIDCHGPHISPTHHLLRTLVMCARPEDVSDVIMDGKLLMQNRILVQADEAEIVAKARERMLAVARRARL